VTIIVILGCLLLMVAFRSILIPLTAAFMNLLAVAAPSGSWWQSSSGDGQRHHRIWFGTDRVVPPIVMIAILFGLSMDYQVFLVSRMHEEWVNTNNNEDAIIHGQANTAESSRQRH